MKQCETNIIFISISPTDSHTDTPPHKDTVTQLHNNNNHATTILLTDNQW